MTTGTKRPTSHLAKAAIAKAEHHEAEAAKLRKAEGSDPHVWPKRHRHETAARSAVSWADYFLSIDEPPEKAGPS